MTTLAKELRFTPDIGMFTLDRPIPTSCVHKTEYCDAKCFNVKLYRWCTAMRTKDIRNEVAWIDNDAAGLAASLDRKKKQTDRIRLMSRGEAFSDWSDLDRVAAIAEANPSRLVWIPTRAWRNPLLQLAVKALADRYSNVRILASMDPSNSAEEWTMVKAMGWSTMFFGDDDQLTTPNGDRSFKCPKTHRHLTGHCAICKGGCFRADKRVDVHLKEH